MDKAKCKSCGKEILWVKNAATGRLMPVDASPDPEKGNVALHDGSATVLGKEPAEVSRRAGEKLHLNHFATCPNAKQHRRTQ